MVVREGTATFILDVEMFHTAGIFYCVFAVMQHIGVVLGGVLYLNLIAAIYSRQISICILSHDF